MVLNLNRAPKRLDAQKKDEHAQFSGSIPGFLLALDPSGF